MSGVSEDSRISSRNSPAASLLLRRGRSLVSGGRVSAEGDGFELDLFSRSRIAGPPIGSASGSDVQEGSNKFVGEAKIGRIGMDDLLDADIGKHDYDWLLTPPGTPQAAPLVSSESQLPTVAPKRSSTARSSSTTRASRLSVSQTENGHSLCFGHLKAINPKQETSYPFSYKVIDPSLSSCADAFIHSSKIPTNFWLSSSIVARSTSRPSTPTRQSIARTTTPASTVGRSPSVGRLPASNGRVPHSTSSSRPSSPNPRPRAPVNSASSSRPSSPNPRPRAPVNSVSSSRPSSPNPRPRAPVRPINLPDFPNDVPPNLRTKLPERPLSAGRARPGMALTIRASSNSEPVVPSGTSRRLSLPIISRSKFPENPPKASLHSNGHYANSPDNQKPVGTEAGPRRNIKPVSSTENTGFGRTISKKSLDMAIKHMDIRQSLGGIRGASIFPHSIRSAVPKGRTARVSETIVPITNDEILTENGSYDGTSGDFNGGVLCNMNTSTKSPDTEILMRRERMNDIDLYGSYRYDAMLTKEDLKNASWLLSADDKSDQGSLFDHRFEPLPEPF
ncbi:hypothetical protein OPV22_016344 [Ensete ventricosum]|uniref:DUF3741 domain-containing protein n=1 Tax=Ensete ventricosum TaxID=4639 RepID=A0AAV8QV87_ENSVE|nr:hypothetical protein OPV22_016344 [Ensete ventricosum]